MRAPVPARDLTTGARAAEQVRAPGDAPGSPGARAAPWIGAHDPAAPRVRASLTLARPPKIPGHYISDKKLQPLAALMDQARPRFVAPPTEAAARADGAGPLQIKVCVHEFNKVDKTSKVKRALRAGEFKESFEAFNVKLKCALPASVGSSAPSARSAMSAGHERRAPPPRAVCERPRSRPATHWLSARPLSSAATL